jgi:amino acid adenylation domain-containing protein/thioester reductase-like protein
VGLEKKYAYDESLDFLQPMIDQIKQIIISIEKNPSQCVKFIDNITHTEKNLFFSKWNNTSKSYKSIKNIPSVFFENIEKKNIHKKVAIIDALSEEKYTYNDIEKYSNKLTRYLDKIIDNKPILLSIINQAKAIICMLGILKSGKCYVPIPHEYPDSLVEYIIQDTKSKNLLVDKEPLFGINNIIKKLKISTFNVLEIFNEESKQYKFIHRQKNKGTLATDAYIMYTSGSTGKPKGITIKQKSILRLVYYNNFIKIDKKNIIAQTSSLSFDASTFNIWGALLNGATLVNFPRSILLDSFVLQKAIIQYKVDTIWLTARLLDKIFYENKNVFLYLKRVIAGGDVLSPQTINQLIYFLKETPCRLYNGYGPTENTTFTTTFMINKKYSYNNIPIGKPITNTKVWVLNQYKQLVPIGAIGELYITGDGLTKKYINRDELTKEKFIKLKNTRIRGFNKSDIAYRTGDLVAWLPDGNLLYFGRLDTQFKVSGYRVELEPIQAAIVKITGISECCVLVKKSGVRENLVCFMVCTNYTLNQKDIEKELNKSLPVYMIPKEFICVDKIPFNKNEKTDQKKLWQIYNKKNKFLENQHKKNYDPKLLDIQKALSSILKVNDIKLTDNFFEIGGNSLLVSTTINKINKIFKTDITIRNFLENPTIHFLYDSIKNIVSNQSKLSYETIKNDITHYASKIKKFDNIVYPKCKANVDSAILITGITGFLGRYVLLDLLSHYESNIYCLVRQSIKQEDLESLYIVESQKSIIRSNFKRIFIIEGDCEKPLLGLTYRCHSTLVKEIGLVFHLAAYVNHIYPYNLLRNANVIGTYEIIRFCFTKKKKILNYVSTLSAFPVSDVSDPKKESFPSTIKEINKIKDGYSQTKWVSEYLLKEVTKKGLCINVFRPGWILGDSETGYIPLNNHLMNLIKSCIQLSVAPNWECQLYFLPVDLVSKIIAVTPMLEPMAKKVFNINNIHSISWSDFIKKLRGYGYKIDLISITDWYQNH